MRDTFYTAIDIGTSKVTVLISRVGSEGDLKVFGTGVVPSEGIQKGRVEHIEDARASVRAAMSEAQRYIGETGLSGVYVSVSGSHIRSTNRREVLDNEAAAEDISPRMLDDMLRGSFPKVDEGQQILHVIPMGYTVDGLSGVRNPLGLAGKKIEVDSHVVMGDSVVLQNSIKAVETKDVFVKSLVLQGIASAEATLTGDEREMGVVMLDIGAGTTDLVVYRQGSPWFSDVLPVGAQSLTRDLAAALGSSMHVAEDLKINQGSVYPDHVPDNDTVEIPDMKDHWQRPIPRRALAEPLNARMTEILKMALTRMRQAGMQDWPIGGMVLTGGGAQMLGLPELVEEIVGGPVRVGYPYGISGLPAELRKPTFSAAVGLLVWGIKHQDSVHEMNHSVPKETKTRRWRFRAPMRRRAGTQA
ncbi:Cell division protein FtsA [Geodia barretti]|uniref:Cell division protein FtsA n=1 Tax=Geodia barretti TaxID=519541 RepID=A0AA35R6G8_GEOBA|nr:Cell division protein FtsA [Geodia barretti]